MRLIILVISFSINAAFSQIKSGTIAVLYYTPTKIIIAADSRMVHTNRNGRITFNDDECKIATLSDKLAFVASGMTGYDPILSGDTLPSWRAATEAGEVFLKVNKDISQSKSVGLQVAEQWGARVQSYIAKLYSLNPGSVQGNAAAGVLTSAIIAEANQNGELTLWLSQVVINDGIHAEQPVKYTPATCPICSLGEGSIFLEFTNETSDRAKEEAARWKILKGQMSTEEVDRRWTIRLADLTILLFPDHAKVGGFIDALELTAHGIQWIQRKPNCK